MLIFSAAERRNCCSATFIPLLSFLSAAAVTAFVEGRCKSGAVSLRKLPAELKLGAKMRVPGGAVEVGRAVWVLLELNTCRCFCQGHQKAWC